MKTAVLYLRVSTKNQVDTDYDPEGISLPAQRRACEHKAAQLGVRIIDEYIEPGRSATTVAKRLKCQEMVSRIRIERDVDYVIVYKLSRLHRNQIENALVADQLQRLDVELVSATEAIDGTRNGQLLQGILAAINQFRSAEDGADIRDKMAYKAQHGGTVTRAKIGYVNFTDIFEDRRVNAVAIDPERAPLIQLAFELCATGEYSMTRLARVLADRGLRMRPQINRPAQPISAKYLPRVLSDPYYLGIVTFKGEQYPGRHEALVTRELFDRVQTVLAVRAAKTGERQRQHRHYLKSLVWCGRCHDRGVESRLIYVRANGRGGEYWYFMCAARQHGQCDSPYMRAEDVEETVAAHYAAIRLPADLQRELPTLLAATLASEEESSRNLRSHYQKMLTTLDVKEENLLDLVESGAAAGKVRERLQAIEDERTRIRAELTADRPRLDAGAALLSAAIEALTDPHGLYLDTSDTARRELNQAVFGKLYLDPEQDGVTDQQLREPFDGLVSWRALRRPTPVPRRTTAPHTTKGTRTGAQSRGSSCAALLKCIAHGEGPSKGTMVELRGFEPLAPSMRTPCGLYQRGPKRRRIPM